jgi:hypothetical protein
MLHHGALASADPPDYRNNVFKVDVDPANSLQVWTQPTADRDNNGVVDVEQALNSIRRFGAGEPSCNYGSWLGSGSAGSGIAVGGDAFGPIVGAALSG